MDSESTRSSEKFAVVFGTEIHDNTWNAFWSVDEGLKFISCLFTLNCISKPVGKKCTFKIPQSFHIKKKYQNSR